MVSFRFMHEGEEFEVCALVKRVFDELVAPGFEAEGIEEFYRFANPEAMKSRAGAGQVIILAEEGKKLVGMIEIRNGTHVALLFVERRGDGTARQLLAKAVRECMQRRPALSTMTVNSSPYAEEIYRKLGFRPSGVRQTVNGIVHLPMELDVRESAERVM
ncbi:MAG: GNAT family N-acetyltransferase [Ignavibacteriales bacterium]|nr:GNAT family N-acetyltransferase [Ignavibacteriales bacterium]